MIFRKLNIAQQVLLKMKDHEAYKNYKFLKALQQVNPPLFTVPDKDDLHFKHSGNAGDIIYSLPVVYGLANGKKIHFHLQVDRHCDYGNNKHPLGNLMLNEQMVTLLKPLLIYQENIECVDVYDNQPIDFDLDKFREYPLNLKGGNIAQWYFLTFGMNANLNNKWLNATPEHSYNNTIVIARSHRYQSPGISYDFLNEYPRKIFVGVEEEYLEIKKMIPSIEYRPVKNFLELANIIAGSKLFIGNQSFPFALAEGLKTKRILELYHQSPNVNVEGSNGYVFCFQQQFEKIVADLMN